MKLSFKNLIEIFLIIVLSALQIGYPNHLSFWSMAPDFFLTLGIVLFLVKSPNQAILILIAGGLILDIMSNNHFGWITIALISACIPIYVLMLKVIRQPSFLLIFFSIFLSTWLYQLLLFFFIKTNFSWPIIFVALENSILGYLIYLFSKAYIKKHEPIKL